MKRKMTENDFNEIVSRKLIYHQTNQQIANTLNISEKSVKVVLRAFVLVRDEEFETLKNAVEFDNVTITMIEWAARELKKKVPIDELKERHERKLKRNRVESKREVIEKKEEVKEQKTNDALYMIKILEALNKQNELLEQLMDVVIPKYVSDMKDNLNANADVICERLKSCEQSLEKISYNTRKRGA